MAINMYIEGVSYCRETTTVSVIKTKRRQDLNSKRRCSTVLTMYVIPIMTALLIGSLVGYVISRTHCSKQQPRQCRKSPQKSVSSSKAFDPMSQIEMERIERLLIQKNIIDGKDKELTFGSAYITSMTILVPDKGELFDHQRTSRMAEVHVVGKSKILIFHIGPLGEDFLSVREVENLPLNSRHIDRYVQTSLEEFMVPTMTELTPLFDESFDKASYPKDIGINFNTGFNKHTTQGRHIRFALHLRFPNNPDQDFLYMLPVSGVILMKGDTLSGWKLKELFYCKQGPYGSVSELLANFTQRKLNHIKFPNGFKQKIEEQLRRFPKHLQFEYSKPRSSSIPNDASYTVNGYTVRWSGWTFTISNNQIRGLAIYNASFMDTSVFFEVALQDILVNYVSDTHGENNVVHLLSAFDIGVYENVIIGLDCPERATVLDTTYWDKYQRLAITRKSICIFEGDKELPLWKKKNKRNAYGMKGMYLAVRANIRILTLEYYIEYRFNLDGSFESSVYSFGYLQGAYWHPLNTVDQLYENRNAFGYHWRDVVGGVSGTHSFNFKVDLDVTKRANRFEDITWRKGSVVTALRSNSYVKELPEYFASRVTNYLESTFLQVEGGLKQTDKKKLWVISDDGGRGYQVTIDTSVLDVLHFEHPAFALSAFTRYNIAVLRQKPAEIYLTSPYNNNDYSKSLVNIDKLMDPPERIYNEDIVLSVNIGFVDIPTKEDIPVRQRNTASFRLLPFNIFPETPVMDVQPLRSVYDNQYHKDQCSPSSLERKGQKQKESNSAEFDDD